MTTRNAMLTAVLAVALTFTVGSPAGAATVGVEVSGIVIFNSIGDPPLGGVGGGEDVTLSFEVDSDVFVDGVPGDTRGYAIDPSSFALAFSSGVVVGLENPFPAGVTPYFALVDGFPVADGFFVSTSAVSPGGVPLAQDPVNANLDLGYDGATLASLDILDAVGTYDFTGLTRFAFNLWQVFPDNVVADFDYASMTIEEVVSTPTRMASWGEVKSAFE